METTAERWDLDPWAEIMRLRAHNVTLTATVARLSNAIAELTDECPPWAPSVAIVYWLWSDTQRAKPSWRSAWGRIKPLVAAAGQLPAPKLKPLIWEDHRARRRLQGISDGTLNLELTYAKAMLNWAVDHGIIRCNPLLRAKPVAAATQRETRLTPGDVEKLLEASDDVINRRVREGDDDGSAAKLVRALILCMFDGLLRITEARTLRLARLQPDGSYELYASETKARRGRIVTLTPRALEAIAAIQRPPGAVYVFEDKNGLVTDNRMRHWFRRACELAGIDAKVSPRDKRFRPHDCRAGGATAADELGARPRAIQGVLGHADLRMTQRYLRSEPRDNAAHVGEIMGRLGPKKAPRHNRHGRERKM